MGIVVLDEDFLLNRRRAMEFRDCVREGGRPLSMFVFSSIKAISQYTVQEILEMGIDGMWIGYEGTRSGYAKQRAPPEALPGTALSRDQRPLLVIVQLPVRRRKSSKERRPSRPPAVPG
jgi:hypothetical protein